MRHTLVPWLALIAACDTGKESVVPDSSDVDSQVVTEGGANPSYFEADGLASAITEEACTLSGGTETTCYRIPLKGAPVDHDVGPFCPRNITDDASVAGIWIESGSVYDVDGDFITELAEFYSDPEWMLYDEQTGEVRVTTTQAACEAAARPDVDPEYNNYCVECSLDDVDGGVETTILIPVRPVPLSQPMEIGMATVVGAAFNGVAFDPPAPVQAILAAHTIAAFDDCGGHVNTAAGYHYHAATGCSKEVATTDGHAPIIGYALDGYAIHAMNNEDGAEPTDLDSCRGHEDARGYHYHVAGPGETMFLGCFHGDIVGTSDAGGGGAVDCADGQSSRCCGDSVCDGPETADNCPEDCQ